MMIENCVCWLAHVAAHWLVSAPLLIPSVSQSGRADRQAKRNRIVSYRYRAWEQELPVVVVVVVNMLLFVCLLLLLSSFLL